MEDIWKAFKADLAKTMNMKRVVCIMLLLPSSGVLLAVLVFEFDI